jgi:hypothetical protein
MVSEYARISECGCTRLGHLVNTAQIKSICFISQGSQASREREYSKCHCHGLLHARFCRKWSVKMHATAIVSVLVLATTAQIESIWVISQGSQASTESTANVTVAG